MNVNFRLPVGSAVSHDPFPFASRHPVNSSLPVATNCDEDV
jgi:hypothetical protein